MFIAVDDTDSRTGGCTTYLITEIIRRMDTDIIGSPRLVRLNPAVPWKTRGNASLVLEVGTGGGEGRRIGRIAGRDVMSYGHAEGEPDQKELLDSLVPVLMENRQPDSCSGLIVSKERPAPSLYWKGVRTMVSADAVKEELERISALYVTAGDGRGIVGAACGMAWVPGDRTFELIAYRRRERWGTERMFDPSSIGRMDSAFPSTFNSWEERWGKVTMVPSTPCPVLYGLRGDSEEDLPRAAAAITSEDPERWIVFETNQGTDDHIIPDAAELVPDRSYAVEGRISGYARHLKGGHVLLEMGTAFGTVTIGAYEPSKEFRWLFDNLVPGDEVRVLGELRNEPRTLNAEKVQVLRLAEDRVKISNPVCPSCGRRMKSAGKDQGFRCRTCRTASRDAPTETRTRWVVPGWYEPPAAARRHLSKPLKRMGAEQPLDFVNRRMS